MKANICICGPYPEPVGGVSTHVRRLVDVASKDYDVSVIDESPIKKTGIFNLRSLNILKYFKIIARSKVVHVHSSVTLFRFIHSVTCFILNKPVVITVHSFRDKGILKKILNSISFKISTKNVVVSRGISESFGYPHVVLPAFITPSASEMVLDEVFLNLALKIKNSGRRLVVTNAFRLDIFDNKEIYGFGDLIDLFSTRQVHENYGMIMNVSSIDGCLDIFNSYKQKILDLGLSDCVYILNERLNFPGLLKMSDVFIRATTTDGDALSVRESLLLGVRTIASDCVVRPNGTIIYQSGNLGSLQNALLLGESKGTIVQASFESQIIEIYKGLI
jgi:hypothetical protein